MKTVYEIFLREDVSPAMLADAIGIRESLELDRMLLEWNPDATEAYNVPGRTAAAVLAEVSAETALWNLTYDPV